MSRVARWKIDKTKVKVVFRLQFHATHIPQTGWDKLHISFIPSDSGKATAKTTKAIVRNGTCKWGDPIYETTRLLQDIKTKQYDEKLYKFIVAMGSSRSTILGEATINLADYADASQPSTVALPLHGCDSNAILHVTVQLLTSKTGFREFEQQRELREKGFQSGPEPDPNVPEKSSIRNLTEENTSSQVDKVNSRVKFEENLGSNEEYGDSAVGLDGSSSTSESLWAEKHDTSSTNEVDSLRSTASGDLTGLIQSPQKEKGVQFDSQFSPQGASDWVHGWSSDYLADKNLAVSVKDQNHIKDFGIPAVTVSRESDSIDAAAAMKEKIFELMRELDESKAERESLTKKMDQMECYYEALVQELEENQRQMVGELQSLKSEHSTCLFRFQTAKAEMVTLHREMNEQVLRCNEEKSVLESLGKDLERRAGTAEAALKRARLNYSIAVEQLQKDLEVLSFQVLSMYETHDDLIKQACGGSPPTSMQNYQKQNTGEILSEPLQRSLQLQESIYQNVEEEVSKMHYVNVYLDVFSSTLQETLIGASSDFGFMKKRIDELTREQELLVESKELLIRRLEAATDDASSLKEDNAICIAKCNDMALQKQILEANLEYATHENRRMTLKINELEPLIMECKNYKSMYDACVMEKTELADLLKEETRENGSLKEELKKVKTEFDESTAVKNGLQDTLNHLQLRIEAVSKKLKVSSGIEENQVKQQKELLTDFECLEVELQQLTSKSREISEEILVLESVSQESESSKLRISKLEEENKNLTRSLQDTIEESSKLLSELNCSKENLQFLQDELLAERSSREKSESIISELTMQMNEKHYQMMDFGQQKSELVHLKQMVSELESERSRSFNLLQQSEECRKNDNQEFTSVTLLEAQLSEMREISLAADVGALFIRTQYEAGIEDLVQQLSLSEKHCDELQHRAEDTLSGCLARESNYTEENTSLSTSLTSLKSELEAAVVENKILRDEYSKISADLEKYKNLVEEMELNHCEAKRQHAREIERLNHSIARSEEEINGLLVMKEELEINLLVLKSKLDEGNEVTLLQNQCNELSRKLSEQIMKTEEFEKLSIHFKELKDKANEEYAQAREKLDAIGPPLSPVQESLRIAFLKEQYETKLQEMKHHLSVSKKHGEEMLWKLQDSIDEIESRKKSEASHLKKNELLGLKIMELEAELQAAVSGKREKEKAYDRMKAEMECSMISLECCIEEKQKLEASLQDFLAEKCKLSEELSLAKQMLEASSSTSPGSLDFPSDYAYGDRSLVPVNQNDSKDLALVNSQLRARSLRSSMDHLNSELERMKNENLLLSDENDHSDSKFPTLQTEMMQLHKVNEELAAIYPPFNEHSGTGNALERVLALEIDLAEALHDKRKSSINDEETIFKSFRDINELIKEMLELKGRYMSVETELREMHGRYSQLSLQFAEVEGERQKLMMTMKSVRGGRKGQQLLIRSLSGILGDQS